MNIASVSLFIFIIVSPAILARRVYFTKELSKSYTNKNTLQEIFSSVFLAGLLHSLWILIVQGLGFIIDFEIIFKLLFDSKTIGSYLPITNNIYKIIFYFLTIILASVLGSYFFRNIVRLKKWDRTTELFRYDNNWYYLLTGEVLDIKKYSEDDSITSDQINQRVVDVLVKSNEGNVIYRGNLVDFQLDKDNKFDYLVLSFPEKMLNGVTKIINSSYFIIPYSEILNLNLRYLSTSEE